MKKRKELRRRGITKCSYAVPSAKSTLPRVNVASQLIPLRVGPRLEIGSQTSLPRTANTLESGRKPRRRGYAGGLTSCVGGASDHPQPVTKLDTIPSVPASGSRCPPTSASASQG